MLFLLPKKVEIVTMPLRLTESRFSFRIFKMEPLDGMASQTYQKYFTNLFSFHHSQVWLIHIDDIVSTYRSESSLPLNNVWIKALQIMKNKI